MDIYVQPEGEISEQATDIHGFYLENGVLHWDGKPVEGTYEPQDALAEFLSFIVQVRLLILHYEMLQCCNVLSLL